MGFGDLIRTATSKATDLVKDEINRQTEMIHMQSEQTKMQKVMFQINSGYQLVHASSNSTMFQRQDGTIYFNNNFHDKFLFVDYIWSGPEFEIITDSTTNTTEQEITKRKSGKVAAGAVVGSFLAPGVGTIVGAAVRASGKKKKNKSSQSNTNSVQRRSEILTPATLKFKNIDTGAILSIVIGCNTLIDSQIKGFQIQKEPSVHEVSKYIILT